MDFALRSACLNAATVVMSGFGAPARASTPIPLCMRLMRLSASSFPLLISPSMMGGPAIRMSKLSPLSMRSTNLGPKPVMTLSLFAVARSNSGLIFSRTVAPALAAKTLISAAFARGPTTASSTSAIAVNFPTTPQRLHKIEQSYVLAGDRKRPRRRDGSNATEMDRSRYVRFPPESDRIAEVPDWQLRAMRHQREADADEDDSTPAATPASMGLPACSQPVPCRKLR